MATQVLRGTRGTSAPGGRAPTFTDMVRSLVRSVRADLKRVRTRRQLRRLSDRELADIGLTRARIESALRWHFPFA